MLDDRDGARWDRQPWSVLAVAMLVNGRVLVIHGAGSAREIMRGRGAAPSAATGIRRCFLQGSGQQARGRLGRVQLRILSESHATLPLDQHEPSHCEHGPPPLQRRCFDAFNGGVWSIRTGTSLPVRLVRISRLTAAHHAVWSPELALERSARIHRPRTFKHTPFSRPGRRVRHHVVARAPAAV